MTMIMASKDLKDLYDSVQKDAGSSSSSNSNASPSFWVHDMDASATA
jgi:hypothetical protein